MIDNETMWSKLSDALGLLQRDFMEVELHD